MKKTYFILNFLSMAFIFSGCREYRLYRYAPLEVVIDDCSILVTVLGQYGESFEVDGKKLAEWGGAV